MATRTERLSLSQKNANNKQWYKDKANEIDTEHYDMDHRSDGVSEITKMKVNYDLFNNKLNLRDFEHVCKPYGSEVGELPATMHNRDITSGKIKAMLGMEMKRPFAWNVIAVNQEATTRKEQEEYERHKKFVENKIMLPIRQQIELQKEEQYKGRELTEEEKQQIQQEIEQELQAQTPEEVRKYMMREHQDPSEILNQQLLEYTIKKCDVRNKFNIAFKHGLISGKQVVYLGILNDEPQMWNVNSLRFNCIKSPDIEYIEDCEKASCEYILSPSEVIKYFGDTLTDKEIDKIYEASGEISEDSRIRRWFNEDNPDNSIFSYEDYGSEYIKVLHCVWKSLRRIGFLTYLDDEGLEQQMIVDENYKINKDTGDISLDWEWIPEVYETWKIKISEPIYVNMRPIPGQFKDLDNIYESKLPYYGIIYDSLNSETTSLMDRLKIYQYYYNIIMYRLELLLASDKGKKVLMNINAIPDSAAMPMEKWQYLFEATNMMWYDPNEEGNAYSDANTIAKVIDLSMVSDIKKYMDIAEYIRLQAGRSVGITDQVEGQIGTSDAVSNTRQALVQSSHILEYYFDGHARFKKNVLEGLLELNKIAYSNSNKKKISYILDDLSMRIINVDTGLLDNNTMGLFVENSARAEETKETIRQLAHAAMQTQTAELSDIITLIRQDSIPEMEETLKLAQDRKVKQQQELQKQQSDQQQQMLQKQEEYAKEARQHEADMIILKAEEDRKTKLLVAGMTGASFNPEQDENNNNKNDFLEAADKAVDKEIKSSKVDLDREKFEHQKEVDNKKLSQEDEKIKNDRERLKTIKNNRK